MSTGPKVVSINRGAKSNRANESTVALVEGLYEIYSSNLFDRLGNLFDSADNLLFSFAERVQDEEQRSQYFDAMRVLRIGRRDLTQRFKAEIQMRFGEETAPVIEAGTAHDDDGFPELSLLGDTDVERGIAITNMATKAQSECKNILWDVNNRIQTLIDERQAPISPKAIDPDTICEAFKVSSVDALKVEFHTELIVLKLFERTLLEELKGIYVKIQAYLKQNGIGLPAGAGAPIPMGAGAAAASAPAAVAPVPAPPPPDPGAAFLQSVMGANLPGASGGSGGDNSGGSPAGPMMPAVYLPMSVPPSMANPVIDLHTLANLQQMMSAAASFSPGSYAGANSALARDLATAAQGQLVPNWSPQQATSYVQRASLVGHMFNDLLSDPNIPHELRSTFDALRLPTLKAALDDSTFVQDANHPVRSLINELATMAATARSAGPDFMERMALLMSQIQGKFDVGAEKLRQATAHAPVLDDAAANQFVEQQKELATARRETLVKRARQTIKEELELRTRGIPIAKAAKPALQSLWAPMMGVVLTTHGIDSEEWRSGIRLLQSMVDTLNPKILDRRSPDAIAALVAQMNSTFSSAGMDAAKVSDALTKFEAAAYGVVDDVQTAQEVVGERQERASDIAPELLTTLIQPGAWFLVYDHEIHETRWLKAVAYYQGLGSVSFAEFDGGNTIMVQADTFLQDLKEQRSVAVDMSPVAMAVFERFQRAA